MKTQSPPAESFTVPATIARLWSLHPLAAIRDADSYNAASDVCARLAARRLNAVQRKCFRELTTLAASV